MTGILSLLFFVFSAGHVLAQPVQLNDAVKKGLVKVTVNGKGGYTGEVMEMEVKNLSGKELNLLLEAGQRLDSKDSTRQDMLVNRDELFALGSGKTKKLSVSGMCCQAHKHSPSTDSKFLLGRKADSMLVKIAKFIHEKKLYSSRAAQHGVWVLSDNNPIESIYDGSDSTATRLVTEFVCKLLNKPYPTFRIQYASDTAAAFSGKPDKLYGVIEYYSTNNGTVTIAAYDKNGKAVKAFIAEQPINPGPHTFPYEFNVASLPSGKYYIRVRIDGQLKKEVEVQF